MVGSPSLEVSRKKVDVALRDVSVAVVGGCWDWIR